MYFNKIILIQGAHTTFIVYSAFSVPLLRSPSTERSYSPTPLKKWCSPCWHTG